MLYSDLIDELNCGVIEKENIFEKKGVLTAKLKYGSYLMNFDVKTKRDIETFRKPVGNYILINKISLNIITEQRVNYYANVLCEAMHNLKKDNEKPDKVLIVGLGNEDIQCDSLGVCVCEKISQIKPQFNNLYVYSTNVFGKTGIESYDIVESIVKNKKIDLVIIIDSLCAGAKERLNTSIQLTNAGISPGSGVNNTRRIINSKNLKCDVVAIGVPLMIYSSSFIFSSLKLENSELNKLREFKLKDSFYRKILMALNDGDELIVASSNIKEIVGVFADIIFKGILKYLIAISV